MYLFTKHIDLFYAKFNERLVFYFSSCFLYRQYVNKLIKKTNKTRTTQIQILISHSQNESQ